MKLKKEILQNILILIVIYALREVGEILMGKNGTSLNSELHKHVLTCTFYLSFTTVYFINYLVLVPRFIVQKKYVQYGFSFLGLMLVFACVRFMLEEVILFKIFGEHNYFFEGSNIIGVYLVDSFYYTLVAVLLSVVISLLYRYNEKSQEMHQLELAHQKAQMSALKSQISPHFLFNTLNSFYVELFDTHPETANDILKLCNLLRYVTYETSTDYVTVEKEISFIKDYMYFFERRYEDNFFVELNIHGDVRDEQVPSLILIHFIENVCKHGIISQEDKPAFIDIYINTEENKLEVITKNHINISEKYHESGIGTENIRKRLEVLYGDAFELYYQQDDHQFEAYLSMPLQIISNKTELSHDFIT
ncbi:sensor histidine kinase [Aureibacter tunicatorum]|uniref:Sensor histidine kinase YesM n=1 Tax=Aureibacter tunicatorum TaxID=866807 RepID=A0AAE4BS96_9BACT|nr:histidine kinase [Aureibacter tunicatorum]MDR6239531.1 sensor histidine kinase YesM [Aureibacter tunicatorum]BDD04008.1 histidine kinase [Aureibacter tunicatorum]